MKRAKMTTEQAKQFKGMSVGNMALVMQGLNGKCACEPYADVFTYGRWRALGHQVRRGEHGIRLPVIVETEDKNDEGEVVARKLLHSSAVFCRCQVDQMGV